MKRDVAEGQGSFTLVRDNFVLGVATTFNDPHAPRSLLCLCINGNGVPGGNTAL